MVDQPIVGAPFLDARRATVADAKEAVHTWRHQESEEPPEKPAP